MNVQILTPEKVILNAEVESIQLPGIEGQFQILNNHTAIISSLKKGEIFLKSKTDISSKDISKNETNNSFKYEIKGGVLEFNNNKAIILCD